MQLRRQDTASIVEEVSFRKTKKNEEKRSLSLESCEKNRYNRARSYRSKAYELER